MDRRVSNIITAILQGNTHNSHLQIANSCCSSLSFGVVLWELLTGEKPYTGLTMFVVAYGVGHGTLSLPIPASCPIVLRELMSG